MPEFSAKTHHPADLRFMELALEQAQWARKLGEVPVGAVLVKNNQVISSTYNKKETGLSATYHAEILAIEQGSLHLGHWRLTGCTLYVTLEPCVMCAGALVSSRVSRLVYGATDPKGGGVESCYQITSDPRLNHQVEVVSGVMAEPCSQILKDFFKDRRK